MKDNVKEILLQDFKKSNKERKLKLAIKYGFKTTEEYLKYLTEEEITKEITKEVIKKKVSKPTIHIVNILDASGSMSGEKYDNSKEGILTEIGILSKDNSVDYTYTLVEFVQSGVIKQHYLLDNFPTNVNFYGARGGNTPLYITVYQTIETLRSKISKEDKVLVKVFTDGGNNTDHNYTNLCKNLIEAVSKENFTVTFVGTDSDIERIKRDISIEDSNTLKVKNTGAGFKQAFEQATFSTQSYSAKVLRGENVLKGFYKKTGTL